MTYVGTVPSSVGDPTDYAAVARALLSTDCGVTVDPRGNAYAGDGIAVALPEYGATAWAPRAEQSPERAQVITDQVTAWVRSVAHAVTAVASPRRYFGAWLDNGTLHLDVTEVFSSAEEDRALDAARRRGQLAVWHAGRREEIRIDEPVTIAA